TNVIGLGQAFLDFFGLALVNNTIYRPTSETEGEKMRLLVVLEAQGIKDSPPGKLRVLDRDTLAPRDPENPNQAFVQLPLSETAADGSWDRWMLNRGYVARKLLTDTRIANAFASFFGLTILDGKVYRPNVRGEGEKMRLLAVQEAQGI